MPTFDWMHVLALAAGALATALYTRTTSTSSSAATPTSTTKQTTAAPTASMTGSPLFDALLKVVEGKLSDLIAVEPGPDGSPMFTVRVVLAPEAATTPATTVSTPAAAK
jgi:hypothetical protein